MVKQRTGKLNTDLFSFSNQKDLKNLSYSITMGNNNKLKIKNDNKK